MSVQAMSSVISGTLHLTAALPSGPREMGRPALREVNTTLSEVQRAINLGWTSVPMEILVGEHGGGPLPALPSYEVAAIRMASPLQIAMTIPREVLAIPAALAGLAMALERVLTCKARIHAKREALEADRSEAKERRLSAEARIEERLAAASRNAKYAESLQVTSVDIYLEER
jgi:hypothetical protein